MPRDFLDEIVAERTAKNREFPRLVGEAEARRKTARFLTAIRERLGVSQTLVAAKMGTSASVVSKLEAGGDVRVSTLMRYCSAIGEAEVPSMPLAAVPHKKSVARAAHR